VSEKRGTHYTMTLPEAPWTSGHRPAGEHGWTTRGGPARSNEREGIIITRRKGEAQPSTQRQAGDVVMIGLVP
jgi:hypothetical protein